jgi:hypothetical protein
MAFQIPSKFKDFIASKLGRIIIVTTLSLLVLLAVILVILRSISVKSEADFKVKPLPAAKVTKDATVSSETTPTPDGETTGTPLLESSETITDSYQLYEFKDPFRPLEASESTSSASTTGSESQSTSSGEILELKEIFQQEGSYYARIQYGSIEYIVTKDDQIGNSPYKVIEITSSNVTLLYGDDQIVLSIGEQIIK